MRYLIALLFLFFGLTLIARDSLITINHGLFDNELKVNLIAPAESDLAAFTSHSQSWFWGFKGALLSGPTAEIGVIRSNMTSIPFGSIHVFASNEFRMGHSLLNPKMGIELGWWLIGGRVNLIDYIEKNDHDIRFRPEAGFSLFGILSFYYGFNINLNSFQVSNLPRNIFSMTINMPIGVGKWPV